MAKITMILALLLVALGLMGYIGTGNVTIALLGFLGGLTEAIRGYVHAKSAGMAPDQIALASKLTLAGLLFIYVLLCVRSFIAARRTGKV